VSQCARPQAGYEKGPGDAGRGVKGICKPRFTGLPTIIAAIWTGAVPRHKLEVTGALSPVESAQGNYSSDARSRIMANPLQPIPNWVLPGSHCGRWKVSDWAATWATDVVLSGEGGSMQPTCKFSASRWEIKVTWIYHIQITPAGDCTIVCESMSPSSRAPFQKAVATVLMPMLSDREAGQHLTLFYIPIKARREAHHLP